MLLWPGNLVCFARLLLLGYAASYEDTAPMLAYCLIVASILLDVADGAVARLTASVR